MAQLMASVSGDYRETPDHLKEPHSITVDATYRDTRKKTERPPTTPSGRDKEKSKMPRPRSGRAKQALKDIQAAKLPSVPMGTPAPTPIGGVVGQIKQLMTANPNTPLSLIHI